MSVITLEAEPNHAWLERVVLDTDQRPKLTVTFKSGRPATKKREDLIRQYTKEGENPEVKDKRVFLIFTGSTTQILDVMDFAKLPPDIQLKIKNHFQAETNKTAINL